MAGNERPRYSYCGDRSRNVDYRVNGRHYLLGKEWWSEMAAESWIHLRDALQDLNDGSTPGEEFISDAVRYLTDMGVPETFASQFCAELVAGRTICLSFCILAEFANSRENKGFLVDAETVEIFYPEEC